MIWFTFAILWILLQLINMSAGQEWLLIQSTTQNPVEVNAVYEAISGEPLLMQFSEYSSASLPCNVSVHRTDSMGVKAFEMWNDGQSNGIIGYGMWKDRLSVQGASLQCFFNVSLRDPQEGDAGNFTIRTTIDGGNVSRKMTIKVIVNGLQFSASPSVVQENQKLTLSCRNPNPDDLFAITISQAIDDTTVGTVLAKVVIKTPNTPTIEDADLRRRGAVVSGLLADAGSFLELVINQTLCKDKRRYICTAAHLVNPEKATAEVTQVKTYPTSLSISVTSFINLNDIVQFTCSGEVGDPAYAVEWTRQQFRDDMPITLSSDFYDIKTENNKNDNTCQNMVTSILKYNVSRLDQQANLTCKIANDQYSMISDSTIINIQNIPDQTTKGPGASTDDEPNKAGIIAGAAIGTLAFIILVVLVIVYIWYKKRSKGETYKTREPEDDAPPPVNDAVTYAQPHAKRDKNKGYVNKTLDEPHETREPYTIADKYYENDRNNGYYQDTGYDSRGRYNDGLEDDNTDIPKRAPSVSGSMGSAV